MSCDKVVAFVHAKGHSERLPGKNMADLGGQPLFTHAIQNALAAEKVDRVVIDSDDDEILRIGAEYGAEPLKRPLELASNETTGDDLILWQAKHAMQAEIVVQVVPTCPFTKPESIDRAIKSILTGVSPYRSATGIRTECLYLWDVYGPIYFSDDHKIPNSQDMKPCTWETTGLYAVTVMQAIAEKRRTAYEHGFGIKLSPIEAIDINTQEDLDFARIVWKGLHG